MFRKIQSLLIVSALMGACGDDSSTPSDDDGQSERDAGRRDASTRDAGSRDAATRDARGSDDEEEEDAGTVEEEPTEAERDAGRTDASRTDAGSTDAGSGGGGGDDCDAVSYEAFGESFFTTYCLSCHASMDPTFNDLSEIQPYLEDIRTRVIAPPAPAQQMPPRGLKQPTAAEKTKLEQWIDCGGE
jgi:hypothetical protein